MPIGGLLDASTFIMAGAFVIRRALNVCQSAKKITMDVVDALIFVRY